MAISEFAKEFHEKMFPGYDSKLAKTDPEFIELFDNFAFDEVVHQTNLDHKTRFIAILSTLLGSQSIDEFKAMLIAAYHFEVTPIEMKEIVYQGAAYLGIGRVFPFLHAVNQFCEDNGISLPLEGQSTTNPDNRLEKGRQALIDIIGEHMRNFDQTGDEDFRHINKWLTDNCFGDYYTRNGLNHKQREMITFCFLYAQGGCEPQLIAHAQTNMKLGNDKTFLVQVVSACLPFIGYPRSLNALCCVEEAQKAFLKSE